MHITPAIVEAVYELNRATPPFSRWKLLEPDDIAFSVTASKDYRGLYQLSAAGQHSISISSVYVGQIETLRCVVAHEMIHLRQALRGKWRLARLVCHHHGFDPKAF
jgi:hypothetical protein